MKITFQYTKNDDIVYKFSGKRIKRGLYKSKEGILINADCNESDNIIRKVIPQAFSRRNRGVVTHPVAVKFMSNCEMQNQ